MGGSWGIKPLFTQLNLNAWAFWIVMFVIVVTIFALIRIIYLICLRKLKRRSISGLDINESNFRNSTQQIYTSVIAPHYFYGENLTESVNALKDNSDKNKFMKKVLTKGETMDGVDTVSELCENKTPIRPLTPAYQPHKEVPKEDPLGFLSVPPGFVTSLSNNNYFRVERITHSA